MPSSARCCYQYPHSFMLVVLKEGVSLEEVRCAKWMDGDVREVNFWEAWSHFELDKVHWEAYPPQIPTWLGMFFVVAFSSCLDVAAIQMDLGRQLDFNHELMTVGFSNFISGVTGGFTGSYIFSQTIFNMRTGVKSRGIGVVIIICEVFFFFVPFSILAYVPKIFFGAVLTFIAVHLMIGYLFTSVRTMHLAYIHCNQHHAIGDWDGHLYFHRCSQLCFAIRHLPFRRDHIQVFQTKQCSSRISCEVHLGCSAQPDCDIEAFWLYFFRLCSPVAKRCHGQCSRA